VAAQYGLAALMQEKPFAVSNPAHTLTCFSRCSLQETNRRHRSYTLSLSLSLSLLLSSAFIQGANGSGKHNNWSLFTNEGVNLLNVGQLAKKSGSTEIFPVIMAALVKAVDEVSVLVFHYCVWSASCR
jgi:glutamine synthetase type III